jgi:hypothetical protein
VLLAAADREFVGDGLEHHHPMPLAIRISGAFEAPDRVLRDQAIAVDAHEASKKFLLEFRERLLEQVLALRGAHRNVLELGFEKSDVADRYQMDAAALVDR